MYCHWKIELTGQPLGRKKCHNLKNVHFGKKCPKIIKHIFPLTTTFYDFALKIETSWVNNYVKPSLGTWNVNDVIVCIWYIYSQIKKIKIWNVKNNSKCSKFTVKTLASTFFA